MKENKEPFIDIWIDASGSMGREMEGTLLSDGIHSRMDLVKKILLTSIIPLIKYSSVINLREFKHYFKFDNLGNPVKNENGNYLLNEKCTDKFLYRFKPYNEIELKECIDSISDPKIGSTPLFKSLVRAYQKTTSQYEKIILFITDGDESTQKNYEESFLRIISNSDFMHNIHFIGIAQTKDAQNKCNLIAQATNGSYVNIEAINYDVQALNKFLFPIKSKITQQQIKTAIQQTIVNSVPVAETIAKAEPIVAKEPEKTTSKDDQASKETLNDYVPNNELTHQVERNSRALSQISIQLENIVGLLQGNDVEDSITIEENPIYNQRVGRKAEEILFKKLKTLNWEKVEWLNEKEESYNSYDFYIENKEHKAFYECKGTAAGLNSFHLTANEWSFYLSNRGNYRLCFIQHVDGEPVIYRFMDLLDDLEKGKLKLHHSRNHNVKANSITFFVDVENVSIF